MSPSMLKTPSVMIRARPEPLPLFSSITRARAALDLQAQAPRPGDRADGGRADAVLVDGPPGGFDQARMVGQAEVVVGAEIEDALPVDDQPRALWGGQRAD